ncbi:putative transposable element [Trichonephila clavipes]|nr:putative transposable element [Trichonephila clavipes]
MRTIDDVTNDFRAFIDNENFVPEITSYLKRLSRTSSEVRERIEEKQDQRKAFYEKRHHPGPLYHPGGPCFIVTQRSPTTYKVANPSNPHEVLETYHSYAIRSCIDKEATPVMPLRKRGRPRKYNSAGSSSRTIPRNKIGSITNGNRAPSLGRMDNDEAHFWLNGYFNKQNCRIWSEANPQVYVETPLHTEKLTVWCALSAGGIIGPYFFKNDEGHKVTVNGDRYRAMITNFFIPELNNHNVQELWFQQDGATCHTARTTIDLLKDTFGDRLISRFGPVNWPPRSCDLTQLKYFLGGYVKSLFYADMPQTLDHLEDNIRRVIADIRSQMLEKVIENWTSRLDYIRASRGSHMPEIIFKM